ncbi:hypothetical protein [Brevibacillus borstelensis]|uniref:hypothetical protein n=1 Tax=Brevibacillus borstelensis TaxID=45462 RepID=UPI0030BA69C7
MDRETMIRELDTACGMLLVASMRDKLVKQAMEKVSAVSFHLGLAAEEECEHRFIHLDTTRQAGSRPSWGISPGQQWKKTARFFCEKCLEEKEITKTAEGWEEKPDWW